MFARSVVVMILIFIVSGCSTTTSSTESLVFISENSVANFVELEGDKLLSLEFVVINQSKKKVGPFSFNLKINNEQLLGLTVGVRENPYDLYLGQQFYLQSKEKHGYGGTLKVKQEVSVEDIRAVIDERTSLEIQLLDNSGELIASEWIQTVNVVQ